MIYLELLIGFLEVGLFSFGGGYAAIPLIRDVVLSHGWMDDATLSHMIAVSESTPGPIMVNLATYVGSEKGGILGAFIATAAVVLPAFLFVLIITALLKKFVKNKYFQAVLNGMKPGIIGIIFATGIFMAMQNCFWKIETGLDAVAIALTLLLGGVYFGSRKVMEKGLTPIQLICISAGIGVLVYGV